MPQASRGRPRPGRQHKPSEQATKSHSAIRAQIREPAPVTAQDPREVAAQEMARVETLMLRGVRRPELLAPSLGMTKQKVEGYIKQVHARWEITGGGKDIKRHRGEALLKYDLMENELWVSFQNADDSDYKARSAYMKLIKDITAQRTELLGLTPRVVERLAMMPADAEQNEMLARLTAQQNLASMAGRLAEIIAERRRALGMGTVDLKRGDYSEADVVPGEILQPGAKSA